MELVLQNAILRYIFILFLFRMDELKSRKWIGNYWFEKKKKKKKVTILEKKKKLVKIWPT